MKILFKYTTDEYGCLSNFSPDPITTPDGRVWLTTEHYFQAMKFDDFAKQEEIRLKPTPKASKVTARAMQGMKADWNEIRISVMLDALRYKVEQHPWIKEKLLASGDNELVESSKWDSFWGDGGNGTGLNWLGRCWMQVRKEIRDSPTPN